MAHKEKTSGAAAASRKNMNAVELNAQWVEAIQKEMNNHHLNENFDFNPKNLILISDKPMAAKHSFGMGSTMEDQEALKKKLETLTSVPKRKYPFPITSAQEVGWDNDELFEAHRPKYGFSKGSCAETKYANDYVIMTHKSPFITKEKIGDQTKK